MAQPDRDAHKVGPEHPLIVAGFFQTASGLGESARNCVTALKECGLSPETIDLSAAFGQADLSYPTSLQKLPRTRSGTLILHANAPETERALFLLGLHRSTVWRVIGVWAWELDVVADNWLPASRFLSEIWTPSDFISNVFRPHVDIPVLTVPHYIPPPDMADCMSVAPFVTDSEAITFLTMADGRSSFHRKNLIGSVSTFRSAFEGRDDVKLLVKSRNLQEYHHFRNDLNQLVQEDSRIQLIDRNLTNAEKWRLLHDADCVISPHRSEGFGIHLAEAMRIGRPVVATGWSGNTQFMNSDNSLLLDYDLHPVSDPFNVYSGLENARWAEPHMAQSIQALRTVADSPGKRAEIGAKAQATVQSVLKPGAWSDALGLTV